MAEICVSHLVLKNKKIIGFLYRRKGLQNGFLLQISEASMKPIM
jgi:hypothetical protein